MIKNKKESVTKKFKSYYKGTLNSSIFNFSCTTVKTILLCFLTFAYCSEEMDIFAMFHVVYGCFYFIF